MEKSKIVLRYLRGGTRKGYTHNFSPDRSFFHLSTDPNGSSTKDEGLHVYLEDLKAVFFVKTFEGNPGRSERKHLHEADRLQGRRAEVTFLDGETMQGCVLGYNPIRLGFFLFPADPEGNNIKVFVVSTAVKQFRYL